MATLPVGLYSGDRNFLIVLLIAGVFCIGVSCKKNEMDISQSEVVPADKQESTMSEKTDVPVQNSPCLDENARTAAQRKMDANLICAAHPPASPEFRRPELRADGEGRVLVDIRSNVTDDLLVLIRSHGGRIVSKSPPYKTILGYIPLDALEKIADSQDVTFIMPASEATTD